MKKISVVELYQKNMKFYLLGYDPREIIKLVKIPPKNKSQQFQRPWKEKKVKEIVKYVAGLLDIAENGEKKKKAKGIIPNCPIINIVDPLEIIEENGQNYIVLPDTEKEIQEYIGNIEILDGQHRLISFSDDYRDTDFKDSEKYDMGFVVFQDLTIDEKRELFMIANDKQDKVETNVLRQIKRWLGLLSEEEVNIYNLIEKLNSESISPIKNRIIIGGNKIKHGFKLVQVSKILNKSKTYEILSNLPLDKQVKAISFYLKGWEEVYEDMFNNPKHILGKVSGLRYIMFLFPYVFDILKEKQKKICKEEVVKILQNLYRITEGEKLFEDNNSKLAFRAETATISLARMNGSKLTDEVLKKQDIFNPADI